MITGEVVFKNNINFYDMEINKWVRVPTIDKFKHEVNSQNTFAYTTNCKRILNGVED